MIKRISIENFKSLRQVDLKLGRLNLFIGTNGSGKSNLFDALKVTHRLMGGFSIKEVFEGGARTTTGETLSGLRGGLANALYRSAEGGKSVLATEARLAVELETEQGGAEYRLGFNAEGVMTQEHVVRGGRQLFQFDGVDAFFAGSDPNSPLTASYANPLAGSQMIFGLVSGFAGADREFFAALARALSSLQFSEFDPRVLRQYGAAADIKAIGNQGENFASVVRSICSDPGTKGSYLNWLREMRPHEVDDVLTLTGAIGEPMFALRESGKQFPAPVLSDGTLRFAALAATFFQPSMPQVLAIEEVENGIHGSRLRLLLELLRSQTIAANTQVLATTHSPLLLAWLRPEEYQTTFLCKRNEQTGESRILPLTQVPHFNEIIGKQPITELFAEGWMEAAV